MKDDDLWKMPQRAAIVLAGLLFAGCGLLLDLEPPEDASVQRQDGGPCVATAETCNGADDDCDGRVDELAGADDRLGCGPLEQCVDGACACDGTECGDTCVDLRSDPANCGACGIACPEGCVDGVCCALAPPPVDVLLVVDNSNSMQEEQAIFGSLLYGFLTALERPPAAGLPSIESFHFGVVTTDMGTAGVSVPTCVARLGDDGILQTTGTGSGCASTYPSFLDYRPGDGSVTAAQEHLRCVGNIGTGGCGFEQPLESMLKALTPSTASISFFEGAGHADGANAGFLRPDSVLVVATLTDEDDCSVADPDLFSASGGYDGNLNLRCVSYEREALHPISRYVSGLGAARDPSDVVYVVIGGIPPDLTDASPNAILADSRMQPVVDSTTMSIEPSCSNPSTGVAYPPRRLVQTAGGLDAAGASVFFGTVCAGDLGMPLSGILEAIASRYRLPPECSSP